MTMHARARFCERFNELYPVGMPVRFRQQVHGQWVWKQSRTHSRARLINGEPMVWCIGAFGQYVPLECVRPVRGGKTA